MKKSVYLLALSFLFSLLLTAACENNLDPINTEKGLYSIYGALDIDEDTNYVRIKDLNTTLDNQSSTDIDAEVILRNLNAGISETLEDSVVQFDDVSTHNFFTTMDITPNTEYELTVERSDGSTARALANTPLIADTEVGPTGETCYTNIELNIEPVSESDQLELSIGFEMGGNTYWTIMTPNRDENSPETVSISFSPKDILNRQFDPMFGGRCCFQLSSTELYVRYNHYGSDFFGGGSADTLTIPGGIGTFGGMYDRTFSFEIDTSQVLDPPPCETL